MCDCSEVIFIAGIIVPPPRVYGFPPGFRCHGSQEHHRGYQQARFLLSTAAGQLVLSSEMEHHSNDLPWRRATVVRARVTPDGRLDEDDVDRLLARYGERIALVTVSGASNVTSFIQPDPRRARKAHRVGASIL